MFRMDIPDIAITVKLKLNLRVRFEIEVSRLWISKLGLYFLDLFSIKWIINSFPKFSITDNCINLLFLKIFVLHKLNGTI